MVVYVVCPTIVTLPKANSSCMICKKLQPSFILPFGTAIEAIGVANHAFSLAIKAFRLANWAFSLAIKSFGMAFEAFGTSNLPKVLAKRSNSLANQAFGLAISTVKTAKNAKICKIGGIPFGNRGILFGKLGIRNGSFAKSFGKKVYQNG